MQIIGGGGTPPPPYSYGPVQISLDWELSPPSYVSYVLLNSTIQSKGYFHLCPRMDFLQTLHINNSLYTNYENVFIELDN